MRVICTGPISSGTRLLHTITSVILKGYKDTEVVHRSMPQWDDFWDWREVDGDRFVIIVRRPDFAVRSAWKQGHGDPELVGTDGRMHWAHLGHRMTEEELMGWWGKAMIRLAAIPLAYWVSYEALVENMDRQVENLAMWLGNPFGYDKAAIPAIYDANEQYR